jgi:hypothetical protein
MHVFHHLVLLHLVLIIVLDEIEICECVLLHYHFLSSLIYVTYPFDTFWSLDLETQIFLLIMSMLNQHLAWLNMWYYVIVKVVVDNC